MKDQWGKFYNLTENESIETCFWCGSPTRNRYCSMECKQQYHLHFDWAYASEWCLSRTNNRCADCGTEPKAWMESIWGIGGDISQKDTRLEIHHIDPLNGEKKNWNKKNRPENLICLCHKCHKKRHTN